MNNSIAPHPHQLEINRDMNTTHDIVRDVVTKLEVRHVRAMFAHMRNAPVQDTDYIFPRTGLSFGEFTTAYIAKITKRNGRSAPASSSSS
jgi:hypothetical protein